DGSPEADEAEGTEEAQEAGEAEEAEAEEADGADETLDVADDASATSDGEQGTRKSRQGSGETVADDASEDAEAAAEVVDSSEVSATAALTADSVAAMSPAAPAPAKSATTVRNLVGARPVTVENIVADVLTWVGVRPLADDRPAPATPVSALVQSLWLAVRQAQYTWNNQRPTADVTVSGPGPGGAVTGNLNAVDYDDAALTYTLAVGPTYGRVSIDAQGRFTYTPGAAAAGRGDQFTVRIDDTSGNPFHVHGLLGLLGISAPTEVQIVIASGLPVRQSVSPAFDVDALVSLGVAVTTDRRGAVSVIEGRFTDELVINAADAAVVLNGLAPAFGASTNFVDPSAITTSTAGTGDSAEHFYRFAEKVSGITVLGSEVILVTDALGQVTSVFNYYRGVGEAFDVTPDSSVDEHAEVRLVAATAYLGAGAPPRALATLLARSSFTNDLVVYALADDDAPSLAWRAVVRLPHTGDMSSTGATYVIHADGVNAGQIIATFSNVQPVTAVTTATDWLGDARTITVDTKTVFWFRTTEMVDAARNIRTYKTSYGFWGLGGPVLPGKIIKRSLFGWDRAAVSAHANTAVVYDYFEDVLGRTSWDDAGAPVVTSIKYNPKTSLSYANAFWDPQLKQFGYGDGGYLQAALDIVAHEYTHAVVTSIVGNGDPVLDFGEQGALNEAFADIFGVLIEDKSGSGRWLIGEDSDLGAIRNLANPTSIRSGSLYYRDRYGDRYIGGADDGGEHINSTIFSRAAYLMMTDSATSGVTDETWAKVFYHSLERLGASAMFVEGRAAVLSAAQAQGLTVAERTAIADAFDAVEIYGAAASSVLAV
ncbi:peptidase M4, partial [Mycobacterium sp. ITM-2017-0098]